jgi:16S rRNA pseudouridine516 synthase
MARLDELLRINLGFSRTAAARLIAAGRVARLDGTVLTDRRAALADTAAPELLVDGARVTLHRHALVMLHKPAGVVTALRDDRHQTAYGLLQGAPLFPALRPVGRLDLDSTGLLLWTDDGDVVHRLTHPRRAVPRTYQVALARPFAALPPDLVLADGHRPHIRELGPLAAADAHPGLARPPGADSLARITIVGGAYHEVRRIFAALGSHVLALCRVRYGELALPPDLAPGAWRPIPDGLSAVVS